jgi:hypothetical protein
MQDLHCRDVARYVSADVYGNLKLTVIWVWISTG